MHTKLKLLLIFLLLTAAICPLTSADDDKNVRDANGALISTERDGTIRDASGAIIGHRERAGDGSIVIRDANGKIIAREDHPKK